MMNRRDFFSLTSKAFVASSMVGGLRWESLMAETTKKVETPLEKLLPKRVWRSPENHYFNYCHLNGFVPGTEELVLGKHVDFGISFCAWDFKTGKTRFLCQASTNGYFDIAEQTGEMFLIINRRQISVTQTTGEPRSKIICDIPMKEGEKPGWAPSLTSDGKKILYQTFFQPDGAKVPIHTTFFEVDRATSKITELFRVQMYAGHPTYSPYDSNWIGFCHEGDISQTNDRVWGWKRGGNPECLWVPGGGGMIMGHERWVFHKLGAIAVAFPKGDSSLPRGLYFIDPVTQSGSLISESPCDQHCNIDRTGTWAVVDTWRPYPEESPSRGLSDIQLIHIATGKRYWMARCQWTKHPWHPHPHFSPDGRYIVYCDAQNEEIGNKPCTVVMEINYPSLPV